MSKTFFFLFFSCVSINVFGQQINLLGVLKTDAGLPVSDTPISVAGGQAVRTDPRGEFKIILSSDFKEGERVIIKVIKPGWVINYPLDGEWNLPNIKLQNIQTLNVIIAPKGSMGLWTDARIKKLLAEKSDEIARLKKEGNTPRPIDFSYYLREWADQYGFTPEQVKAAFDDWAKAVEKSDDYRTLGLRAFYQQNFPLAAENFVKAAQKGEEQIKRIDEQRDRKTLDAYQNRKDAGASFANSYQFREALEQYNLAKFLLGELKSKDKHQFEQTQIETLIGQAKHELGIRVEGAEGNRLLSEAVELHKRISTVFTREQAPQQWAAAQTILGAVLTSQGERMDGEEGMKRLAEAVSAFNNALLVYTREQFPRLWAETQNSLGTALVSQGERMAGEDSLRLMAEADSAFRAALQVRTRDQLSQGWAETQANLGIALQRRGELMSGGEGVKLLAEAVSACQNALQVYTREKFPQEWAKAQNNLGSALLSHSRRMPGAEGVRLEVEAVTAFHNALQVYNREQLPQDWAMIQNNLGFALRFRGERMGGEEGMKLLAEAVSSYYNALQVYTREQFPQEWVRTQSNLGDVYCLLSEWRKAAQCYANVLRLHPNYRKAYQRLSDICHERLFAYEVAFKLHQVWLTGFPDDLSAMPNFAEAHFTTGRFAECRERIGALIAKPEIEAGTKIALRMIEIANLVALDNANQAPAVLAALHKTISDQKADFRINWSFSGAIHFIIKQENFVSYRAWLNQFFSIAQEENRDAIVEALRKAQAQFPAVNNNQRK